MMDWSQALYIGLLALALLYGRPQAVVWVAIIGDLAGTMLLADDYRAVAVIDIIAASLLVGRHWRQNVVAAIFLLMQPVYAVAQMFDFPHWITYGCVDAMAYCQLGVIGGVDRGMGRSLRVAHRLLHHRSASVAASRGIADRLARDQTPDGRR
jgi:hypothetical protein